MSTDILQLSERETEILQLVAEGLSNQQIANHLGVSVNTVKVHLRNVFGKIGAASRTEATLYAVRTGLVEIQHMDAGRALETLDPPEQAQLAVPVTLDPPVEAQTAAPAAPDLPEQAQTTVPAAPDLPEQAQTTVPVTPTEPGPTVETVPVSATATEAIAPAAPASPLVMPGPAPSRPARSHARRFLPAGLVAALLLLALGAGAWFWGWPARARTLDSPTEQPAAQSGERWRALGNMRAPRAAFAVATIGDLLYIAGGENEQGILQSVERFDSRFGTWTQLSQKPTAVADVRAAVLGGKIYVPGGRRSSDMGDITDVFERYDPQTERWETLPSLPQPRSGYALAALEGKLFLFGGWDGQGFRNEVFEYDPEGATWRERSPMPTARAYGDAGVVEGSIYVLGGENESGSVASNEVYTPFQEGTRPWSQRAPLPQPRSRFAMAVALSTIHVLGGQAPDVEPAKYNVRTDSWEAFTTASVPLGAQPGIALVDTEVIGLGGKLDAQRYSDKMQAYQAVFTYALPLP